MIGELIIQWSLLRNKLTFLRIYLSHPEYFIAYPVSCLTGVRGILLRKSKKEVFRNWFWDRTNCKPE